jgi:N-formylglutamate deformylase
MVDLFRLTRGTRPLLVSIPHPGEHLPDDLARRMTETARRLPDTDWHLERLYGFAADLGASVLAATHSRYVIDLNRDPAGNALYPGMDNTEIAPLTTFDRAPIYLPGEEPDAAEVGERIAKFWRPYHAALAAELDAIRSRHGAVALFEAHSIRTVVPRFFAGALPDFNFGTAKGASADAELAARAFAVLASAPGYSSVDNGRFTGGYITRHYGKPAHGIHAMQLELTQRLYMDEPYPFAYRPDRAAKVQPVLQRLLEEVLAWAEGGR